MKRYLNTAVLAASLLLILSACGASNGPSTSVNLTMTDFAFLPNSVTVPAGQEITLTLTNSGAVAHDLMIMQLGKEVGSNGHVGPDEHANVFWEQELLDAGQTVKTTFSAPDAPGEYEIVCGVAGHLEAGMRGKLIVVAAP